MQFAHSKSGLAALRWWWVNCWFVGPAHAWNANHGQKCLSICRFVLSQLIFFWRSAWRTQQGELEPSRFFSHFFSFFLRLPLRVGRLTSFLGHGRRTWALQSYLLLLAAQQNSKISRSQSGNALEVIVFLPTRQAQAFGRWHHG